MSEQKHWTVTTAEIARDLTIASSVKNPEDIAAAFTLLYLTIQKVARDESTSLETRIDAATKALRGD